MNSKQEQYNERHALLAYLRFDTDAVTAVERRAAEAVVVRDILKATEATGDYATADQIRERFPESIAPDLIELINDGETAFWNCVCERVEQAEKTGKTTINRCTKCNRIARTEAAKQCLWCGYDWH